jgi:hypothetical protein
MKLFFSFSLTGCLFFVLFFFFLFLLASEMWFIALIGNFVGAVFAAWWFGYITQNFATPDYAHAYILSFVEHKVHQDALVVFAKATGANMVVCLAYLSVIASEDYAGKVFASIIPVAVFATAGWEHVVANMFYLPLGWFYGADITWRYVLIFFRGVFFSLLLPLALTLICCFFFFWRFPVRSSRTTSCSHSPETLSEAPSSDPHITTSWSGSLPSLPHPHLRVCPASPLAAPPPPPPPVRPMPRRR